MVSFTERKKGYIPYEAKRKLQASYDLFVTDAKFAKYIVVVVVCADGDDNDLTIVLFQDCAQAR